jgi:hypothetical protein
VYVLYGAITVFDGDQQIDIVEVSTVLTEEPATRAQGARWRDPAW